MVRVAEVTEPAEASGEKLPRLTENVSGDSTSSSLMSGMLTVFCDESPLVQVTKVVVPV